MNAPPGVTAPAIPITGYIRYGAQVYDLDNGGKLVFGYAPSGGTGSVDDASITFVSDPHCVRYEVTFTGRSGNVVLLDIDTTAITVPAPGASMKGADTTSTVEITSAGAIKVTLDETGITGNHHNGLNGIAPVYSYVHATCDGVSYGIGSVTSSSGTEVIYEERPSLGVYNGGSIPTCASTVGVEIFEMVRHASYPSSNVVSAASATRSLTNSAAFSIMVKDGNDATPCDPLGAAYNAAGCASWIIRCDFTGSNQGTDDEDTGGAIRLDTDKSKLTCVDADKIFGPDGAAIAMNTHIHFNSRVNVYCNGVLHGTFTVESSTATELVFNEIVHDCNGDYVNNADGVTTANRNTGIIITLADQEIKSEIDLDEYRSFIQDGTIKIEVNGVDEHCKVQSILTEVDGETASNRIICSNTFTATDAIHSAGDGDQIIRLVGSSGSEASTCSDRGLCNFETGMCDCFSGYTGIACESQNALHI